MHQYNNGNERYENTFQIKLVVEEASDDKMPRVKLLKKTCKKSWVKLIRTYSLAAILSALWEENSVEGLKHLFQDYSQLFSSNPECVLYLQIYHLQVHNLFNQFFVIMRKLKINKSLFAICLRCFYFPCWFWIFITCPLVYWLLFSPDKNIFVWGRTRCLTTNFKIFSSAEIIDSMMNQIKIMHCIIAQFNKY